MTYFLPFAFSFLASLCLVPLLRVVFSFDKKKSLRWLSLWYRLGGAALVLSFLIAFLLNRDLAWDAPKLGILLGALAILLFGLLDDYFNFSAWPQFLFQLGLAGLLLFCGFRLHFLTNPFGQAFNLDKVSFHVFGEPWNLVGSLLIVAWVVLIVNAFNWLDGVDGLAGGVGSIGFLALFILSLTSLVNQPPTAILSIAAGGALLGFLVVNFPWKGQSSLMLGTAGSYFVGFMLAALSILSGAKIMTTFLVLSLPIFDALWVIWSRWREGKSIFKKDQRHLHFKLLKSGFSQKRVLLFYYLTAAVLGALALLTQTTGKIFALIAVVFLALAIMSFVDKK